MEVPQGSSLHSYLEQPKISFFLSFAKSEIRSAEQVLRGEGVDTKGRSRRWGRV
jgi:hypothetical protein